MGQIHSSAGKIPTTAAPSSVPYPRFLIAPRGDICLRGHQTGPGMVTLDFRLSWGAANIKNQVCSCKPSRRVAAAAAVSKPSAATVSKPCMLCQHLNSAFL